MKDSTRELLEALIVVFVLAAIVSGFQLYLFYPYIKDNDVLITDFVVLRIVGTILSIPILALVAFILWLPVVFIATFLYKPKPSFPNFMIGCAIVASIVGAIVSYGNYHFVKRHIESSQTATTGNERMQSKNTTLHTPKAEGTMNNSHQSDKTTENRPCVFKSIMTDADYYACGITPPGARQ